MSFKLPVFNVQVNVWHGTVPIPPVTPPSFSPMANLCVGRRILTKAPTDPTAPTFMHLLTPWSTDIRSTIFGGAADTVEAPMGSGRYYTVEFVDNVATGFMNQHVLALLHQAGPWTPPTPPPIGGWVDPMTDTNGTIIPPHAPTTGSGGYTPCPASSGGGQLGTCWIQGNTLQAQAVASVGNYLNNEALVYCDPALATYTLSTTISIGTAFGSGLQFIVRYAPNAGLADGYICFIVPGNVSIIPLNAGVTATPIASNSVSLALNTPFSITVQNTPTTIVVVVNAVTTTGTTSLLTGNTKVALGVSNSGMGLDNTQIGALNVS